MHQGHGPYYKKVGRRTIMEDRTGTTQIAIRQELQSVERERDQNQRRWERRTFLNDYSTLRGSLPTSDRSSTSRQCATQ